MAEVRERLPSNVPMGYVDAYYEFEDRPQVTEACDVLPLTVIRFGKAVLCPMQRFICRTCIVECKKLRTESASSFRDGWPSSGGNFYGAESSLQGATFTF